LGLNTDEIAFYDALEVNDSAVKVLGDDTLRMIAHELVQMIRRDVTIDWTIKETVQARIRRDVKRILRKYGYPPDKQERATQTVLDQATLLCRDWAETGSVASENETIFFSDVISNDEIGGGLKFTEYLPVYDLQAVATSFREQKIPEVKGWKPMHGVRRLNSEMFIAQVVGKSMEPSISNGSWCLFRFERGGSRDGLIVLVESRAVTDPETNQSFTIKRYHSEKENLGDGQWRHKRIVLSPDNKDFHEIVLENLTGDEFHVVAEFLSVVKSE
jgi:hypothetical protein